MEKNFVLKGDICYSKSKNELCMVPNGYVICINGKSAGVYEALPEQYQTYPVYDYSNHMILPGLVDLHVHAPQYSFRGLAMDLELIDWLNTYTFVEEAKYANAAYAEKAYDIFVEDLKYSATTRACIFGTIHREATLLLMEKLEQSGMKAYVGKVNMDRNSPEDLCENSAEESALSTEEWLKASLPFHNVKPILTPRFTISCSDELMEKLSQLQKKYQVPMQSHLSENLAEIAFVKELCPGIRYYGEAYDRYGLFGKACPTIMAHCVYSSEEEIKKIEEQGVFIAHCPESNANISSGIAPVRNYLDRDLKIGLGSDVAGGSALSIFQAMKIAIQCSKLRWRLVDSSARPLTAEEAFYLATKGGGEFFGKVGSFEKDYEFDAIVLDDASIRHPQSLNLRERLERLIYLAEDKNILTKFVAGQKIF